MSYCKSPFAHPKVATDPAALSWRQWLPMVDGAFCSGIRATLQKRTITTRGLHQTVCSPLNALHSPMQPARNV